MFFSKKEEKSNNNSYLVKIAALLIHAAKIDENYSVQEIPRGPVEEDRFVIRTERKFPLVSSSRIPSKQHRAKRLRNAG